MKNDFDKSRERWRRHLIPDPSKLFDTVRKNQYRTQKRHPRRVSQRQQVDRTKVKVAASTRTAPATDASNGKKKFGGVALFFLILAIIQLLIKFLGELSE